MLRTLTPLALEDRAMSDPLVLIPARLAATRLPNKPLADIAGEPMIVHVWRRAMEAGIGPVAVATDAPEIAEAVTRAGGRAVMTRADHASGSDRIFEAVEKLDPEGRHDVVVNVQGDLPTVDPRAIAASITPLLDPQVDLATGIGRYLDWIRQQTDVRDYFSEAADVLRSKGIVHRVKSSGERDG